MKDKPLINIITRTSNRPNYFNRCISSIREQSYKNIRHIVSVDDDITENYVKEYDVEYYRVNKQDIIKSPQIHRRIAPYNLYLNELKSKVIDGWILYLDDDDEFTSIDSVSNIVNNINDDNDLLLWKVKFPTVIIPEHDFFINKTIAACHISMIGFMYHHKHDRDILFDGYTLGDFTFIKKLEPKIPKKIWIDQIYTKIQRNNNMGGYGKRDDK